MENPHAFASRFALAVTTADKGKWIPQRGPYSLFRILQRMFPQIIQLEAEGRRFRFKGKISQAEFNKLVQRHCGFKLVRTKREILTRFAGSWLFGSRRLLNPADPTERASLERSYDDLRLNHSPFARTCPLADFLEILLDAEQSWHHATFCLRSRSSRPSTPPPCIAFCPSSLPPPPLQPETASTTGLPPPPPPSNHTASLWPPLAAKLPPPQPALLRPTPIRPGSAAAALALPWLCRTGLSPAQDTLATAGRAAVGWTGLSSLGPGGVFSPEPVALDVAAWTPPPTAAVTATAWPTAPADTAIPASTGVAGVGFRPACREGPRAGRSPSRLARVKEEEGGGSAAWPPSLAKPLARTVPLRVLAPLAAACPRVRSDSDSDSNR